MGCGVGGGRIGVGGRRRGWPAGVVASGLRGIHHNRLSAWCGQGEKRGEEGRS